MRVVPTLDRERALAAACGPGPRLVVGLDEVGRGALAGPVAMGAVAVRLDQDTADPFPVDVRDSKALTARRRETLAPGIRAAADASAIGWASAREIDEEGIVAALTRSALRAIDALGVRPDAVLLDGSADVLGPALAARGGRPPLLELAVGADRECRSVAAASVIAKVARDALMVELDAAAPGYGWAANKGYGSAAHRAAIATLGPADHHRRTWRLLPARTPGAADVPWGPPSAPVGTHHPDPHHEHHQDPHHQEERR